MNTEKATSHSASLEISVHPMRKDQSLKTHFNLPWFMNSIHWYGIQLLVEIINFEKSLIYALPKFN